MKTRDMGSPGSQMMHSFSVEIYSKTHLHQVSIPKGDHGEVLLEGELGEITGIEFVEGRVMVVRGSYGVLRLDVCEERLIEFLQPRKAAP